MHAINSPSNKGEECDAYKASYPDNPDNRSKNIKKIGLKISKKWSNKGETVSGHTASQAQNSNVHSPPELGAQLTSVTSIDYKATPSKNPGKGLRGTLITPIAPQIVWSYSSPL